MKIPFSVFTAHHGYKWSSIPVGMSEAQLTRYEKTISGTRPEYMNAGEYFDGILYDGNVIVVFTAMRVPGWDLAKRTAHYYALAFIPRTECHKVNIDHLLNYDWFRTPMREPPTEIEYTGEPSDAAPSDVINQVTSGKTKVLDFRYCGDMLSNNGHLGTKWQIFRTNVANWNGTAFVFEPNQLFFSAPKSMTSSTSTFPRCSGDTRHFQSEKTPISQARTISLDHSDEPTYQLELRFAKKIEKLRKERENDILTLQNLVEVVAKLKIIVYGLVFVTLLLLVVAVLDCRRIKALVMSTTTNYEMSDDVDSSKSERKGKSDKKDSAENDSSRNDAANDESNVGHSSGSFGKGHQTKKKGGK